MSAVRIYRYFKYDMAKQGKRQVGSTIKPFVYYLRHRRTSA